jgi:Glyoxalase/Bleomycin resistance protein/Dioxygenase superfamily
VQSAATRAPPMSRYYGAIMQNGYVVRDWRAVARHWSEVLGVGPFFVLEHIEFESCTYRGAPTAIDMTVAIAYSGTHQIELVQQHNDAPSIYRDFLAAAPEGLHHVGVLCTDLDAALAEHELQARVLQAGRTRLGQRFAYVDTTLHGGSMLELIEATEKMRRAFAFMQEAARTWDGSDPIR